MRRWLFNVAAAFSLLLSLAAAVAWAMSYAEPRDWHLLVIAHSADLKRVNPNHGTILSMRPVNASDAASHGYWDAAWVLSRSGRLTLVAHAIDYEGKLLGLDASPPSLFVLPGPGRERVVAFGEMPNSRLWARRLGLAWDANAQHAVGEGSVSVKAQMITSPYWFLLLLGLPLPLLWLRRRQV
jgi:hypothetical protein